MTVTGLVLTNKLDGSGFNVLADELHWLVGNTGAAYMCVFYIQNTENNILIIRFVF